MNAVNHQSRAQFLACTFLSILLLTFTPASALAIVEGDQTPLSPEEEIESLEEQGLLDIESNAGISLFSNTSFFTTLAGTTLFDTSAEQVRTAYPSGNSTAIVVAEAAWSDALSSSSLAGALNCPIVFTHAKALNQTTNQLLRELGVKNALCIGGTIAINDSVLSQLCSIGISATRISGRTLYDTQMAIFNYGKDRNCWKDGSSIVATGANFADALSIAPFAFAKKAPVFLAAPPGNLSNAQKNAISLLSNSRSSASVAVAVGGPKAITESTRVFLSSKYGSHQWLWGNTQYDTSAAVAKWTTASGILKWDQAAYTTGESPFDALSGSVLQGKNNSVLLLVNGTNSPTISAIKDHRNEVHSILFFGGVKAMPRQTKAAVAISLGRPTSEVGIPKIYLDAGHGQNSSNNGLFDPGASGCGYIEADLTKDLANRISKKLRETYGIDSYVNTSGWYKTRHADAVNRGCDALVSIHFNANGGSGSESYVHSTSAAPTSKAWQSHLHPYLISSMGLRDRGRFSRQLAVLSGRLPAVLLEVCFIDNASDMKQYQARKDRIASEIAAGIANQTIF